jgi:hypothetical protein
MNDQQIPEVRMPDPDEVRETVARIAEQSQRIVKDFIERQREGQGHEYRVLDPSVITHSFQEYVAKLMADPAKAIEAQMAFWQSYAELWQATTRRMLGQEVGPVIAPERADRRFKDDAWEESPVFDFIKQSYLLASRYLQTCVRETEGLDQHTAEKVDFYTRQYIDAMAPTNFALTNPEVLRRTMETGGENLLQGLSNMLDDLERGSGELRVKMTDLERFELGENVAVTPGHRHGAPAPVADHPAVDQQVLHPRSAREELVHQVGCGPGAHDLRDLVGQPGCHAGGQDLRGLPAPGPARGTRCHRAGDRRARGEGDRLLSRRHPARVRAGMDEGQG